MKSHHITSIVSATVISLLLIACAPVSPSATQPSTAGAPANSTTKLSVVATYSILGDLVANVGGDLVQIETLVGAGGDAHTFEPTPADSVKLIRATLIFENGLEFEPWLDDLYTAAQSQATRVVVSEKVEPRALEEAEHHEEEGEPAQGEGAQHDEHQHGEFDPHIWQSVTNAKRMVQTIRDALVAADPDNATTYQSNAENYLAQLNELENWVEAEVAKLPAERRKLVTSHDTFGYFAERYGFDVIGSALAAVTTEASEPSAADLAALVEQIKATGVPAIFAENISNPKLMEQIAAEANVTLASTLYTDALGELGSDGETYIKMIRYNVQTIVTALALK